MARIGVLYGMEESFPPALVDRINAMGVNGVVARAFAPFADLSRAWPRADAINATLVVSNIALIKHDKAGLLTFAEKTGQEQLHSHYHRYQG